MESSDSRRPSDVLPSIHYGEFERAAREGAQFHQRHPSIARASISSASPISPTSIFNPSISVPSYPQPQSNGIHTPPDSRRTSDDPPGRQSLPSLHEALLLEKPGSFSAPQTPPIGSGPFSSAPPPPPPPPPRNNSMPGSLASAMPRSQPSEPLHPHASSQPSTPHGYAPIPPPAPPPSHAPHSSQPPPPPPPPGPPPHHESPYSRHDSQSSGRPLPPNPPYSQAPPPTIPAMHLPESFGAQSAPPPPPPPPSSNQHHNQSPPYQNHSQYQPQSNSQASSPHYPPSFGSGPVQHPAPPHPPSHPPHPPSAQYPPYQQQQQHHQSQPPPPPPPSQPQPQQPAYQPHHNSHSQYPYQPRDAPYQSEPPKPPHGVKRPSGYGSAIERALSISAIRRDMESIKEHSARIYHIVDQYQMLSAGGQQPYPGGLHAILQEFAEALQRSCRNTEALTNCHQVFQDLSNKELAEQNSHKMSVSHSEYGGDDVQSYQEDGRSNGSQQPEKKIRRGRAAPPGRCHSCHRAETPEWRRGPDGARTLCNACGLHYAKLTRKLSKNPPGSGALAARKPNSPLP